MIRHRFMDQETICLHNKDEECTIEEIRLEYMTDKMNKFNKKTALQHLQDSVKQHKKALKKAISTYDMNEAIANQVSEEDAKTKTKVKIPKNIKNLINLVFFAAVLHDSDDTKMYKWLEKPNKRFNGKTPYELMLSEDKAFKKWLDYATAPERSLAEQKEFQK